MKHTPGPWIITKGDEWTDAIHTETESQGIWTVASVNKRRDEFEANRRLIAAAPDLLAALETAQAGLIWYQIAFPDAVDESDAEAMNEIEAAIAKATGAA